MLGLLMNLIQFEFGVLPSKVCKEDKVEYIQSLIDTREKENVEIFINFMATLHCKNIKRTSNNTNLAHAIMR